MSGLDSQTKVDNHLTSFFQRLNRRGGIEIAPASFEGVWGNDLQRDAGPQQLPRGEALSLELEMYRLLPRNLCAMTLMSSWNLISSSHREYWRATGAFVSEYLRQSPDQVIMQWMVEQDIEYDDELLAGIEPALDDDILNELCLLIELALLDDFEHPSPPSNLFHQIGNLFLQDEITSEEKNQILYDFHNRFHPVLRRIATNNHNLCVTYGYPVLEGLLRRHCAECDVNGEARTSLTEQEENEFNSITEGGKVYCLPGLRLWESKNANPKTEQTLVQIDRLNQQEDPSEKSPEDLVSDINCSFNSSESAPRIRGHNDDEDGIMKLLHGYRNDAQHRQDVVESCTSVLVTLSCLVFWDSISDPEFKGLSRRIESKIGNPQSLPYEVGWRDVTSYSPKTFYRPPIPTDLLSFDN
jgi:hypothetical protein